jgi:hypothetical protein
MEKGGGYELFRSRWRFGWESVNIPEFVPLSTEEIEAIKMRHMKYLKPKQ